MGSMIAMILMAAITATTAFAQTATTGTVLGTASDASGAVIPGVTIELKDIGTSAVRTTITNEAGQYRFTSIVPGQYTVTATLQGFRQAVISPVAVETAKSSLIDIKLELGEVSETVEVTTGAAAELQTVDATIGQVIDSQSLINLPTLTRRVVELVFLQVATTPNTGSANNSRTIGGARGDQNTYTLDGLDVTDIHVGGTCCGNIGMGISVPVESVVEFRGGVTNQNASFGRSLGGQYSMTTRRGSNDLHGAAYWYFRNDNLNANTWTRNRLAQANPELKDNRVGFRVGGPFMRDKLFFFTNLERRRFPKQTDIVRLVPSDTLRQGILRFRDNAGNIISYNLASSTLCGPTGTSPCDPRGIGLSPIIAQQFSLLPRGNDPTSGDGLNTIGLRGPADNSENSDNVLARLDYIISPKWGASATWAWAQQRTFQSSYADIRGAPSDIKSLFKLPNDPYHYNFGVTGQLSPTLVNESRFGFNRSTIVFVNPDPTPLVPGAGVALDLQAGLAEPIDIANSRSQVGVGSTWQYVDNLTWTKGKHTIQAGANVQFHRFFHSRKGAGGLGAGGLNPNPIAEIGISRFITIPNTSRPPTCATATQTNCIQASFLSSWDQLYAAALGMVDSTFYFVTRDMKTGRQDLDPQVVSGGIVNEATWQHYEFHFTDTWRLTNSFTLSLGLNGGIETPPHEIKGRRAFLVQLDTGKPVQVLDFMEKRAAAAKAGKAYNPGFAYTPISMLPGVKEIPTHRDIAPRIAISWNPAKREGFIGRIMGDRKTVLRTGYGVNYQRVVAVGHIQTPLSGNAALAEPNVVNAPRCGFNGTPGRGCIPDSPNAALSALRVGPDGPAPLAVPVSQIALPYIPPEPFSAVSQPHWDPAYKLGYVHSMNVTIQRELPKEFLMEVGWIGRLGRRLPRQINLNAVPFFITDLSGRSAQTFAQGFDAVATELRAGVLPSNVTPQSWFENSLTPGSTARLAASNATDFTIGRVQNLWANGIDPMLISLGRAPINNRQIGRTLSTTYGGWNNYNAGFISLNKRLGAMSFNFNYTFSKNLETLGGITDGSSSSCMNNWDFRYCYGPALSDRTHGVNFYGVFELPFGQGRYFNTSGALDKIVGGWQVSGVTQWFSGKPLNVSQGDQPFGSTVSQESAPLIRDPKAEPGRHDGVSGSGGVGTAGAPSAAGAGLNLFKDPEYVFNSFRRFLISQDTGTSRGRIRGLPWFTLDLSVAKKARITEKVVMGLSFDFLNFLNHPLFNDPSLDLNNPRTFGVITSEAGASQGRQIQVGLRFDF